MKIYETLEPREYLEVLDCIENSESQARNKLPMTYQNCLQIETSLLRST